MDCKHPSGMVQYLGHTAWQWCTLCGSLYHPGPGATWERPKGYDKMAVELAEAKEKEGPCDYSFPCANYHDKCQATADDLRQELAETKNVLNNLLSRVKFDENTPPGEHWHVMAILLELVQENDRLKAGKGEAG